MAEIDYNTQMVKFTTWITKGDQEWNQESSWAIISLQFDFNYLSEPMGHHTYQIDIEQTLTRT